MGNIERHPMLKKQILIIAIDDSGVLCKNENYCVFAGIIFFSELEKERFIKNYKKIVDDLKCRYCKRKTCDNNCPELKYFNLKKTHQKRFIKYLKNYSLLSVIIDNRKIYSRIIEHSKSKGRYLHYAIKMMIKNAIESLIKEDKLNNNIDLDITINIDELSYKTNGLYNLEESIYEELSHGMKNIKRNAIFKNIINSNLNIQLEFKNSATDYLVQAADLVAGTIRSYRIHIQNTEELKNKLNFINYQLFLP